jgi:hypothetical protein
MTRRQWFARMAAVCCVPVVAKAVPSGNGYTAGTSRIAFTNHLTMFHGDEFIIPLSRKTWRRATSVSEQWVTATDAGSAWK